MAIGERAVRDAELMDVLAIIRGFSVSPEGREHISPSLFTSDISVIRQRADRIEEYMNRLSPEEIEPFPYITDILEYPDTTHADFSGPDIYRSGQFIHSYIGMLAFLGKEEEIHAEDKDLESAILSSIDSEGNVYETHPRLLPLLKARDAVRLERERFSSSFMSLNRGIVQQSEALFRSGRIVIPIRSDQSSRIDCYISGASASGSTLYAEPFELVALNNDAVIAEERIRAEKARIIHELSDRVRMHARIMRKMLSEVIDFDFHFSFARWAASVKAARPSIGDRISLSGARHPLLGKKAVPIALSMDSSIRVLVLSGANAGGKTVTMKTLALSVMLHQISGYIPADSSSILPVFSSVFTDIGDGQSIQDAASTFSSHMKNIAYIARHADSRALVVLDELGSGTDPEEGAALSRAILSYLASRAAFTCVTSHYSQVKSFAYTEDGMMNASMEFDAASGLPTYRVLEGIPGDSHAIATAIRMRMPHEITDAASEALRGGNADAAHIIQGLISRQRTLDRKVTEAAILRRKEEKAVQENERRSAELERMENDLRKEGVRELNAFLRNTRRELERLVMDVRTGALTPEKTRRVKEFIRKIEDKKEEEERAVSEEEEIIDDSPLEKGDPVLCGSSGTKGKVLSVSGSSVEVLLENGLRMSLRRSMVRPDRAKDERRASVQYPVHGRKAEYTMDVRGLTLEETLRRLDDQMEAAILSGLSSFSIIHGYGDGILSRGVHDYLGRRREVRDYGFARPEDGGMGKTYVELF